MVPHYVVDEVVWVLVGEGRRVACCWLVFVEGHNSGLMKHFGAEVGCWAHNPKVVGSRPTSAMFSFWWLFFVNSSFV